MLEKRCILNYRRHSSLLTEHVMIKCTEILSTDTAKLKAMAEALQVNPLALEDCIHRDQRPKLDEYEHHEFLVWFMLAKGEVYELQFIIFPDQIIFVPH